MHTINFPLNMILRGDFDFEIEIFEFLVLWFYLHFQLHVFILWQKPHFAMFSFSLSIPRPIICFLSITKNCTQSQFLNPKPHCMFPQYDKNLTSLHSVSGFQSQGTLHIFIVWQKTSLHCAQFQFFNPSSHYMYPMAYKLLNSFQPSIQKPHIKFMWESMFEGHVDHCWSDIGCVVHSHYNMHTVNFPWSTQNPFLLST